MTRAQAPPFPAPDDAAAVVPLLRNLETVTVRARFYWPGTGELGAVAEWTGRRLGAFALCVTEPVPSERCHPPISVDPIRVPRGFAVVHLPTGDGVAFDRAAGPLLRLMADLDAAGIDWGRRELDAAALDAGRAIVRAWRREPVKAMAREGFRQ